MKHQAEATDRRQDPVSLVTVAAGFIGSHVAAACLAKGHDVVVLDDLSGGFEDQVSPGATFIRGSVTNAKLVSNLFDEYRFTYVYHLAAYAAEGLSHFIRRFNYRNNLIGSVTLINEAVKHQVKCFVFTSSIAVYGAAQLPMTEDMTPAPEDPYGVAKYAVEMDLLAAHRLFGLDFIIFRPHNVYGRNQNLGDRYRNVIGIFMNQIMRGEPMTIFGDGKQTRAFSHIDDVAPVIAGSVEVPAAYNEVFNIGADRPYTINHLATVVADAFGVPPVVKHLPPRNEVVHAFSSHAKAQIVFGVRATVDLEQGVRDMAEWAREVGARKAKPFRNIEITGKLPSAWRSARPGGKR